MFDIISLITCGRCIKTKDWYVAEITGVNRLYYIHSGSVTCICGGNTYTLTPGQMYIFPQNLTFRLVTDESTEVDHTYFDFLTVPAIVMNEIMIINQFDGVIKPAVDVTVLMAESYPYVYTKPENYHTLLVKSYLDNLLALINEKYSLYLVHDMGINNAIEYIHDNFQKEIIVKKLAMECNLEVNVFIRKFKKNTGTTPFRYIKNLRINYAVSLIKNGGYTLGEIAEKCGYSDCSALSHAVKKTYGLYPKEIASSY